ncbi:hypothetical protein BH11CYA1_BH11CYA1_45150 [soil metagenome]
MSHTGGGGHGHGGHHGLHGGHPDQSAGWNSALQGEGKPITSLPNPTIMPIIMALVVFVIMLLPFVINWDADGVEFPGMPKRPQAAAQPQQGRTEQGEMQGQAAAEQAGMQGLSAVQQQASQPEQQAIATPPASIEQQLQYASQQSFAQNANQQNQAVNPNINQAAQQPYSGQQSYQPTYPQDSYGQANYAPVTQPQQRNRVWVDR